MEVKDIVDVSTIDTDMNVQTKEEAIKKLSNKLFENGYISNIDGFIKDIYKREEEGKTGIGNYIAIPHGKSTSVNNVGVAIGINREEISWETLDGRGVKGVILFAVGNDNAGANEHLKILSLFARKLGNDEVVEQFLEANNVEEVIEAFN